MEAAFVLLWFLIAPGTYEVRYLPNPVPAYVCTMMAIDLRAVWHADGQTCAEKPPAGAKPLPASIAPERYA